MKLKFLLLGVFVCLAGCQQEESKAENNPSVPIVSTNYKLTSSPLPVEQIEAETGFIGPYYVSNGMAQLSYELNLANFNRTGFELTSIDLVRPNGDVFYSFDSDYLDAHFYREGLRPKTGNRLLKGNEYGAVNLWISMKAEEIPAGFFHRLKFNVDTSNGTQSFAFDVSRTEFPKETKTHIKPPFSKGIWFFSMDSHRDTRMLTEGQASYAQRYALDWAMTNETGGFVDGPLDQNESYPTYGQSLLAVTDGVVIAVKDGIGDNNPETGERPVRITRDTIVGNYVMLDIGNGLNAVYAHLIPGSLTVKVGDMVTAGQEIGRLGNSGNSDGPHLHFHIETRTGLARPLAGEGVPYYLDSYTLMDMYSDGDLEAVFTANQALPFDMNEEKTLSLPTGSGMVKF